MASASATRIPALVANGNKCFYCDSPSTHFRRGWQLKNGDYAGLCDNCACSYENGSFCKIFHWDNEGWRTCLICDKIIHCGCVMSAHSHIVLDFGGVKCMDCVRKESIPVEKNNKKNKNKKSRCL